MPTQPGDTPDPEKKAETPAPGTDTPPQGGSSTPDEQKNELERERARAATAQKGKEDAEKRARDERVGRIRAEKELAKMKGGSGDGAGSGDPAGGNNSAEETQARLEAERGVMSLLAFSPQYNELLTKDPTLREVLSNNPLSLIKDFIDADDAVEQIRSKLDARLQSNKGDAPNAGSGDGKPETKEVKKPGSSDQVEMTGTITPEQASKMSPADWAKLPKDQREKLKQGHF